MELEIAVAFVHDHHAGTLVTIGKSGRPQITNIMFGSFPDGLIRISITAGRQKTKNIQNDNRVSLFVQGNNPFQYVVLDGTAVLSDVAATPKDAVVDELVAVYEVISGEHSNWDEYRTAMCDDKRLVVRFTPDHAYGMLPE